MENVHWFYLKQEQADQQQHKLEKTKRYKYKLVRKTLCIDVAKVFLRKLNLNNDEDLSLLEHATDYSQFMIIDKNHKIPIDRIRHVDSSW